MKNLCCIFNTPSLYRETIYLEIDRNYECEWYFEEMNNEGIEVFDTTKLKKAHSLPHKNILGRLYRMKGLTGSLWRKNVFDAYLMIGTPMCVSIWVLCLLLKVCHPTKKIYFWTHGWYGKESASERIIKKIFLKLADGLFIYGDYAIGLLLKEGFDKNKLHAIHNSLAYDVQLKIREEMKPSSLYKDHFANNNPVLIFIGRLTAVKKLDLLLESVALLRQENRLYNLVFVGDGVEKKNLEAKVKELNLAAQVWFYGACYDETTNAELIYNADLCVAPGNIGLTAMHVLMFGCPAVTHNDFAYQMPEFEAIKPNKTGDFFERNSSDSLAVTIKQWFEVNGGQRDFIRRQCYAEIDENWNPNYQMRIIKSVIDGRA